MQWTASGGFTEAGVEPWLPMGDASACNVAAQRDDPESMLHLCRDLIALRRDRRDLHAGAYEGLESDEQVWAWRRGERTVVAFHHGESPVEVALPRGRVLIGTDRGRDGETVDGPIRLEPWEAIVLEESD